MNLLNRFTIIALLGILAAGSAFGQSEIRKRQFAGQTPRVFAAGSISAENVNSYYVGYDFDLVARYMKNDDKFRDSVTQMSILWDELYLKPEASDIEALMRMTIRGQGTLAIRLARLEKAKTSVEKRLIGDGRWFYNVGLAYSQMYTALEAKDVTGLRSKMTQLGQLSRTAPGGTPAEFVAALSKLGSLNTTQFSESDIALFDAQCEVIANMIAA
jgi:hypothetical protein